MLISSDGGVAVVLCDVVLLFVGCGDRTCRLCVSGVWKSVQIRSRCAFIVLKDEVGVRIELATWAIFFSIASSSL